MLQSQQTSNIGARLHVGNSGVLLSRFLIAALIPIVAPIGAFCLPLDFAGITLYGFRYLVILSAIVLAFTSRLYVGERLSKKFLVFGFVWITYGVITCLWAPDLMAGIKEILSIILGVICALIMIHACQYDYQLDWLRTGWIIGFLFCACIGFYELLTNQHPFPTSVPSILGIRVAFCTFGNPNDFGAYLVLSFPILYWSLLHDRGARKALALCSILALPVLLIFTMARLSIAAFVLQLVCLLLLQKNPRVRLAYSGLFLGVGLVFILGTQWNDQYVGKFNSIGNELRTKGSARDRLNLYTNGLWFCYKSFGLGIGAGGYEILASRGETLNWTKMVNPHSLWIEMLSQYGVIPVILLVGWLISILGYLRKRRRGLANAESLLLYDVAIISIVGFVVVTNESSSAIDHPMIWAFLAVLAALVNKIELTRTFVTAPTVTNHVSS